MSLKTKKHSNWLKKFTYFLKPKKTYRKKEAPLSANHHDLQKIFETLNATYFQNALQLPVEWSGRGKTSSNSVIRLGFYNQRTQKIKINRLLDSPEIPSYFVSFIIYHEILHHLYPPIQQIGSKRKIHHSVFLQKEQEFLEYAESKEFLLHLKKTLFQKKVYSGFF